MGALALLGNRWVLIGLAMAALLAVAAFYRDRAQTWEARYAAAQQQVVALGKQIEAQNAAVAALKAAADRRKRAAANGLKTAQERARSAQEEAARLRAAANAQIACSAAVAKVREGLQ